MERSIRTSKIIQVLEKTNGMIYATAETLHCSVSVIEERAKKIKAVQDVIDKYKQRKEAIAEALQTKALIEGKPWAIRASLKKGKKNNGFKKRRRETFPYRSE